MVKWRHSSSVLGKLGDIGRRLGGGIKRHPFGHGRAVFIPQMPVGLCHEDAAVFVPQPAGNHFEINPGLDGVAAKEVTAGVVGILRQARMVTGGRNRFAGVPDLKHLVRRLGRGRQTLPDGQ